VRKQFQDTAAGAPASTERYVQLKVDFLRNQALSAEAKLIGCLYATYRGRDGLAWPGVRTLMKESGFGRDKVLRARKELVRHGHLEMRRSKDAAGRFEKPRYKVSAALLVRHSTETQYCGDAARRG
jgi:hypothetical protein